MSSRQVPSGPTVTRTHFKTGNGPRSPGSFGERDRKAILTYFPIWNAFVAPLSRPQEVQIDGSGEWRSVAHWFRTITLRGAMAVRGHAPGEPRPKGVSRSEVLLRPKRKVADAHTS